MKLKLRCEAPNSNFRVLTAYKTVWGGYRNAKGKGYVQGDVLLMHDGKLYRSSTIENDYPEQFVKIWKCPTCGTLHVFSAEGSVKNVFIKENSTDTYDYIEEGLMFGDYLWNDITDRDISNDQLLSIKPSFYVRMSSDYLIISETLDFSNSECYRLYLPEWMKE